MLANSASGPFGAECQQFLVLEALRALPSALFFLNRAASSTAQKNSYSEVGGTV